MKREKTFTRLMKKATDIALSRNAIFWWDYICGDVLLCDDEEVK